MRKIKRKIQAPELYEITITYNCPVSKAIVSMALDDSSDIHTSIESEYGQQFVEKWIRVKCPRCKRYHEIPL